VCVPPQLLGMLTCWLDTAVCDTFETSDRVARCANLEIGKMRRDHCVLLQGIHTRRRFYAFALWGSWLATACIQSEAVDTTNSRHRPKPAHEEPTHEEPALDASPDIEEATVEQTNEDGARPSGNEDEGEDEDEDAPGGPLEAGSDTVEVVSDPFVDPSPTATDLTTPVSPLSVGWGAHCTLTTTNEIACWGENDHGVNSPPAGEFVHVAVAEYHGCAIDMAGALHCWGAGIDAVEQDCQPPTWNCGQSLAPTGAFIDVAVGGWSSCGVRADGSLTCWGRTDFLGNIPQGAFVQVVVGWVHACALDGNGAVTCFGANNVEQGNSPQGTWKQLSSVYFHTCALDEDGRATCWGSNVAEQLNAPDDPMIQVSAGYYHSCGLTMDHRALCWGGAEALAVDGINDPPDSHFLFLDVGAGSACGQTKLGTIECWPGHPVNDPPAWLSGDVSSAGEL
jgi:hypothetical protein